MILWEKYFSAIQQYLQINVSVIILKEYVNFQCKFVNFVHVVKYKIKLNMVED